MKQVSRRQLLGAALAVGAGSVCSAVRPGWAAAWHDRRLLGPFRCYADFPLAPYRPLLDELVRLEHDLTRILALPPPAEPVELYLLADKRSYHAFLTARFPGIPYRRALFVKDHGPGRVIAYRQREFATDLRHEGTHALLHASLDFVPLWLDEGLAEYFEVPADRRVAGHSHFKAVQWRLFTGRLLSMRQLEDVQNLDGMGKAEYRSAWAWVHFMLHGPAAARAVLRNYVRDIESGRVPGRLSERLGRAVPGADRALGQHFNFLLFP